MTYFALVHGEDGVEAVGSYENCTAWAELYGYIDEMGERDDKTAIRPATEEEVKEWDEWGILNQPVEDDGE